MLLFKLGFNQTIMPLKKFASILQKEAAARVQGKERKQWRKNRGSYIASLKQDHQVRLQAIESLKFLREESKKIVKQFPFIHNHSMRTKKDIENMRQADLRIAQQALTRLAQYAPKKERLTLTTLFENIISDYLTTPEARPIQGNSSFIRRRIKEVQTIRPTTYQLLDQRLMEWVSMMDQANAFANIHQPSEHTLYHGIVEAKELLRTLNQKNQS